jgi:hypothetical protein
MDKSRDDISSTLLLTYSNYKYFNDKIHLYSRWFNTLLFAPKIHKEFFFKKNKKKCKFLIEKIVIFKEYGIVVHTPTIYFISIFKCEEDYIYWDKQFRRWDEKDKEIGIRYIPTSEMIKFVDCESKYIYILV